MAAPAAESRVLLPLVCAWPCAAMALVTCKGMIGQSCWPESGYPPVLLQTLNTLCFRGLPGSLELNQQLANHFTEKVKWHNSQHVWPRLTACGMHSTACIRE